MASGFLVLSSQRQQLRGRSTVPLRDQGGLECHLSVCWAAVTGAERVGEEEEEEEEGVWTGMSVRWTTGGFVCIS